MSVKEKCVQLVILKKMLDNGFISYGNYIALMGEVIKNEG